MKYFPFLTLIISVLESQVWQCRINAVGFNWNTAEEGYGWDIKVVPKTNIAFNFNGTNSSFFFREKCVNTKNDTGEACFLR